MKAAGLLTVISMLASCGSAPYYGGGSNGYRGGSSPYGGGGIDTTKTAALVVAGIAGLSLYHYGQEKKKRKRAERAFASHQQDWRRGDYRGHDHRRNDRRNDRRGDRRNDQGGDRRGRFDSTDRGGRDFRRRGD